MTPKHLALMVLAIAAMTGPATAHPGASHTHLFSDGFAHPFGGADHVLAMVTLGLWASFGSDRRLWVWPLAFVVAMIGGALLGLAGVQVPMVEPSILASIVVIGALTALAVPAPIWLGAAIAAVFAIFHGHAHGAEAPAGGATAYIAGFVMATALLHGIGVMAGLTLKRLSAWPTSVRTAGLATAAAGLFLSWK